MITSIVLVVRDVRAIQVSQRPFFNRGNKNIVRGLIDLLREANQEIPPWLDKVASESTFGGSGFRGGRGGGRGSRGRGSASRDYRQSGGGFGGSFNSPRMGGAALADLRPTAAAAMAMATAEEEAEAAAAGWRKLLVVNTTYTTVPVSSTREHSSVSIFKPLSLPKIPQNHKHLYDLSIVSFFNPFVRCSSTLPSSVSSLLYPSASASGV